MVKYMFRENLQMAKDQFMDFCTNANNFRKMPNAKEVQKLLTTLVDLTLRQYGEVGIFDPEKLAAIDFLSHPEQLVALVVESKERQAARSDSNADPHPALRVQAPTRRALRLDP